MLTGVPGAFTPVCTDFHLPGLILAADELSDAFVMSAWAKAQGAGDMFLMMADPDAEFAQAMGLDTDAGSFGLGIRSERYASLLEGGACFERWTSRPTLSIAM